MQMGNYIDDVDVLNRHLTGGLVEYNFKSPYQLLGYAAPIEFLTEKLDEKVLPMVPYSCEKLTGGIKWGKLNANAVQRLCRKLLFQVIY